MCFVLSKPVEVIVAGLVPPAVFAKTRFAADEVVPRNHAAGHRFIHPHLRLLWTLRNVTPARSSGILSQIRAKLLMSLASAFRSPRPRMSSPSRKTAGATMLVVVWEYTA